MKETLSSGPDAAPSRKWVVVALAMVLLAGVGALIAHFARPGTSATEEPVPQETAENTPQTGEPPQPSPVKVTATSASTTQVVPSTHAAPGPTQLSPHTRQTLDALLQLNMTNGPLTPEKLAAWQNALRQLTNQGPAALSAIREFLQSKQDMSFDSIGGASVMGQPSMRLALLDSLFSMGGPEARNVAAEAMRSSMDPREIATIARTLEQQAPGEFGQAALEAARAALAQARQQGYVGNLDVGALFDILQRYGGAEAIQDFQDAKGRWTYYSAIALGQLPEGQGIPALVAMAQDSSGAATQSAALQMLAQWASESADARNVLLEKARSGNLGAATWIKISSILGGEQVLIGSNGENGLPAPAVRPVSTYHLSAGNQNFYTVPVQLTAEQINQRLQLIDQLVARDSSGMAIQYLQRARTGLQARLQPAAVQ